MSFSTRFDEEWKVVEKYNRTKGLGPKYKKLVKTLQDLLACIDASPYLTILETGRAPL